MPNKTKQEKLRAAIRRKQNIYQILSNQSTDINKTTNHQEATLQETKKTNNLIKLTNNNTITNTNTKSVTEEDQKITQYFYHDFFRSLFFILAIIALEIIFYFASMNSNFVRYLQF